MAPALSKYINYYGKTQTVVGGAATALALIWLLSRKKNKKRIVRPKK